MTHALTGESACLHNASMPNILIRNVPEQVHARLTGRAEAAGVSLQQYVLDMLSEAMAEMTTREAVEMMRANAAARAARGEKGPTREQVLHALHEGREERTRHLLEVIDEARRRRGRLSDG